MKALNVTRFIFANKFKTKFNYQAAFFSVKKFTKSHEWISYSSATKEGTIGISVHAQHELGDIVHLDLPTVPKKVSKGDTVAGIESVKTASDIYSPATGEIMSVNDELKNNPALVNEDAENRGWLIKMRLSNEKEIDGLMTEEEYKKFLESEKH